MIKEESLKAMEQLQLNIEKLFERDRQQQEIINRLNLIIAGDKEANIKGLAQRQKDVEEELAEITKVFTGAKAIFWLMGIIGVGGLIVGAKIIMALVEISEHIGK